MKHAQSLRIFLSALFFAPSTLLAAESSGTIQSIAQLFVDIVSYILPGVMTLVFVYFFWGLAKYVSNVGDEKKETEGRAILTWGVVAVFIGVSLWGIIGWLQTFIGNPVGPAAADLKINLPHL
ncbi:MAG: hypothetical protein HYT94_01675 [Parcubacteria group bacterium]|nr:hypothetical protein [Parcubacteria group bacterium]